VREFEFGGCHVPAGAYVNYSSWASHRLPEVFPHPEAFIPERFERERKAALPRGAYVPFGGGTRICIGKRFGQTEVKLVTTMLLQRFRLELAPGHAMSIRQMPTLSPDGGLPMVVRERDVPEALV
jgi:cytochrome P450